MAERVRIGVIGTSGWVDFGHLPGLKAHPGADLVAICGRDREGAEAMARKYGIPDVFTNYRDLIARGDLQALVVVTPDDLHHPIVMEALAAKLHVLCEKPIASTVDQAREMYDAAEAAGVRHLVNFSYRWFPPVIHLRDLVAQGYVGRPYHCNIRYFAGYARDARYRWRYDRRRAHGALSDLGSHMIDLAQWCLGDIVRVNARLVTAVAREGADGGSIDPANDSAMLTVEFRDGAQGVIHLSAVAYTGVALEDMQRQELEIHGAEGTIRLGLTLASGELVGARHDEPKLHPLPVPAALWGDVAPTQILDVLTQHSASGRALVDAILGGYPASPSFLAGLRVQQVIEAAIVSDREGRWVAVG
jgi:predicted dehydrogenase